MNEEIKEETRVRMNASQTAKGGVQLDISTEASTVEKARELMGAAIDALVKEVKARGLTLVSEPAKA